VEKVLVLVEIVIVAVPATPFGSTEISEAPVPITVSDEPEIPPKFKRPAPEIVAVIVSGLSVPAAFFVVTRMYAAGVTDAVESAEITASEVAPVVVPMKAVDVAGLIANESPAAAVTTNEISIACEVPAVAPAPVVGVAMIV